MERSLKQLLSDWQTVVAGTNWPQPPLYNGPDVDLTHLTEKTSEVAPGACFVARMRTTSDGHPYIDQAITQGASMILAQKSAAEVGIVLPPGVVYLLVEDTAVALAWLSAAWEGFPSRQLLMIGITGTDGKTTTANILFDMLTHAGLQVGLLSTVKAVVGQKAEPLALHVTTPEAPVVQRYLRRMVDAGLTHCILESTSHGLAQQRVGAVDFDLAVITNITHEHLDYHGGYAGYVAAKTRLFAALQLGEWQTPTENVYKQVVAKTAVLNRDDDSYAALSAVVGADHSSYALHNDADVTAAELHFSAAATQFVLKLPPQDIVDIKARLVGIFNVYNMLAAAATAQLLGLTSPAIQAGLAAVSSISGRMERIDRGQDFLVIVDFAHTPNALQKAIEAARGMVAENGRIITLFGSAGKRDVEKRRLMAEISAREADLTVLTAEDPRTESLDDILAVMRAGCRSQGGIAGETFWSVADRGRAIHFACSLARANDVVLVCGKGHEQSMCFGTTEFPWDDRHATRIALDVILAGQSMLDLGLPTF